MREQWQREKIGGRQRENELNHETERAKTDVGLIIRGCERISENNGGAETRGRVGRKGGEAEARVKK